MKAEHFSLHRRTSVSGVSLLEVLLTVVILSIGILGMIGLQAQALRASHSSLYRSQAAYLAENIAERMRANPEDARKGLYDLPMDHSPPSGTDLPSVDRAQWRAALGESLPNGVGSIAMTGNDLTITVQWDDSRAARRRDPVTASYRLVTRL